MGYSGIRIPGHSGTQFKHKKGFYALKKYYTREIKNDTSNDYDDRSLKYIDVSQFKETKLRKTLRISSQLIIIFAIVSILAYITYSLENNNPHFQQPNNVELITQKQIQDKKQTYIEKEKENAYRIMVGTGQNYLKHNKLDLAQNEFVSALSHDPHGIDARVGLFKVLQTKCNLYDEYCGDAELNKKYLEKIGYFDNEITDPSLIVLSYR